MLSSKKTLITLYVWQSCDLRVRKTVISFMRTFFSSQAIWGTCFFFQVLTVWSSSKPVKNRNNIHETHRINFYKHDKFRSRGTLLPTQTIKLKNWKFLTEMDITKKLLYWHCCDYCIIISFTLFCLLILLVFLWRMLQTGQMWIKNTLFCK